MCSFPENPMRQVLHALRIQTKRKGLAEITAQVSAWLEGQRIETGLLTIFCRHTSASLLIQENADPDVRADLETFFARLAPDGAPQYRPDTGTTARDSGAISAPYRTMPPRYRHDAEGPDDMPAHIRTALTQTQLAIPVEGGRPVLGTWQGIYLFEHRTAPH